MDPVIEEKPTVRQIYMQIISELCKNEEVYQVKNPNDTVRLFHGTSTNHLNDILFEGLVPREKNNNNNWENVLSHPKLTYLTNKWHYFYASQATQIYLNKKYTDNNPHAWWDTFEVMPAYIEFAVPKELLVIDEDFFFSNYFKKKVSKLMKEENSYLHLAPNEWNECLSQYGTVGVLGKIDPKYIVSFTVIGDPEWFWNYVNKDTCQYHKECIKWLQGKNKGQLSWLDMAKLEEKTMAIGTWLMKDIPIHHYIDKFNIRGKNQNIQILFKSRP